MTGRAMSPTVRTGEGGSARLEPWHRREGRSIVNRLIVLAIPILASLFVAQSALAAGPTITRYPKQYYDFVDSFCGFDVHVQGTASEVDIRWDDQRLIQAYPQSNQVD